MRCRLKGLWFEVSLGKKLARPHLNTHAGYGGVHLQSRLHGRCRWEDHSPRAAQAKSVRLYLKNNLSKKGLGAQVVQYLPSKCKTLSLNPSTAKKIKKKEKEKSLSRAFQGPS
jgi:hypothetical protein